MASERKSRKFKVEGKTVTLDVTDPAVQGALKGYAAAVREDGDEDLAKDVETFVSKLEVEEGQRVQDQVDKAAEEEE